MTGDLSGKARIHLLEAELASLRCRQGEQAALIELGERLRNQHGLEGIARAAGEALGRTMRVARGGYGAVDADREEVEIRGDWCADASVPSLSGLYAFRDFGHFIDDLLRGEIVAISDVREDARTRDHAARFDGLRIRGLLNVPLMGEDGRLAALVLMQTVTPHAWSEAETAFGRAVADRTWAAMRQVRSEMALRALNEDLERQVAERTRERDHLWRSSRDLFCVGDFSGHLTSLNPAWTDTLGWTPAELTERPFIEFVHPEDRPATLAAFGRLLAGEAVFGFENRYLTREGGHRWLSWNVVPADGRVYCSVRDVTAAKALALERAELEERLRQSQKMEAVGQLTGGLAHDFNNLLMGISGSLELMGTRVRQGRVAELDRYLTAAQGSARRAAALTHRLLAFSRRQTLDPRPTDANRLIANLGEMIRRTVGPSIALEIVGARDLWSVLVDPNQLENAILNLCLNARDAMSEGGRIVVETGNRRLDEQEARARDIPAGEYISVCVSDTGMGMTPEVAARAFDPFFTTKPLGEGTGLGLSMIYGFARQSGGHARIASEPGIGSMVCLYLPRHAGMAEEAEVANPGVSDGSGPEGTVLLVDDEAVVRMLARDALEEFGYAVIEAGDAAAGLAALKAGASVDLMVTDVGLPGGMNGRQLADAARRLRPQLKVLFITGYAEAAVFGEGRLEPGTHVLTKPFTMEALAARLREVGG